MAATKSSISFLLHRCRLAMDFCSQQAWSSPDCLIACWRRDEHSIQQQQQVNISSRKNDNQSSSRCHAELFPFCL
eukprot:scaffold8918_cov76-Cylindrotheca_fusiformis.AAC.1